MFTSIENFLRAAETANKVRAERNEPLMRVEVAQGIISASTRTEMVRDLTRQYGAFVAKQIFKNEVVPATTGNFRFDKVPYITEKGDLRAVSVEFIDW